MPDDHDDHSMRNWVINPERDAYVSARDLTIVHLSAPGGLPLKMAVKDPGSIFSVVNVAAFTGRAWLLSEIDRFMTGNPCGYIFIEAEAGMGKTAFAAWLTKTRGYLSHFSRYSGGHSVRAALQNLSAQIITAFELDEHTSGGMLPEWVETPAGFESLLADAAGRARAHGGRLVLVVDGMDEAERTEDGLPFGVPSLLPDGVYIIGTYRPGKSPRQPDAPAAVLRISKDDASRMRVTSWSFSRMRSLRMFWRGDWPKLE